MKKSMTDAQALPSVLAAAILLVFPLLLGSFLIITLWRTHRAYKQQQRKQADDLMALANTVLPAPARQREQPTDGPNVPGWVPGKPLDDQPAHVIAEVSKKVFGPR